MTLSPSDRLYHLLPQVYRVRDAERGEPLRALLALIDAELRLIERDIDGLYDDIFIETCAEWVVPYIGDLLAARDLHAIAGTGYSQRAYVANTLAYRRRKGTVAVIEQLARDVTGWPCRAVEFFERLITNQQLNHVRLHSRATPDLRPAVQLELLHGPFETAAHSVEVRRIASERGRYNIPNLGLFLWRLQAYPLVFTEARPVAIRSDGRYTFDPFGYDIPLFNPYNRESEIDTLAREIDVPGMLRRRLLYAELEQRRADQAAGVSPRVILDRAVFFGRQPVVQVKLDLPLAAPTAAVPPVPFERLRICDLSTWQSPEPFPVVDPGDPAYLQATIAVDPVLGRLVVVPPPDERVLVSYAYGFSGDVGGGPYDRRETVGWWNDPTQRKITWQMGVTHDRLTLANAPDTTQLRQTLTDALSAWNAYVTMYPSTHGLIAIMDSSTYREDLSAAHAIVVPPGSTLAIVAADWPLENDPMVAGDVRRVVGVFTPTERRPHLQGTIEISGPAPTSDETRGGLVLDGLLIEGQLTVTPGDLGTLTLAHCTLLPTGGGLRVETGPTSTGQHERLALSLLRCICGPIRAPVTVPTLAVHASIIDGDASGGPAINAPGAALTIQESTVFGTVAGRSLDAGNSIFAHHVAIERCQDGCMRFCFVPDASATPRRYRCQPDLALSTRAQALGIDPITALPTTERAAIMTRVQPGFTSRQHGHPAYAQLSRTCPHEITTGAEDEAEIGVFGILKNPQRESNLRAVLDEYLRFGLEAGFLFII